jgi:hypothetical protein
LCKLIFRIYIAYGKTDVGVLGIESPLNIFIISTYIFECLFRICVLCLIFEGLNSHHYVMAVSWILVTSYEHIGLLFNLLMLGYV